MITKTNILTGAMVALMIGGNVAATPASAGDGGAIAGAAIGGLVVGGMIGAAASLPYYGPGYGGGYYTPAAAPTRLWLRL